MLEKNTLKETIKQFYKDKTFCRFDTFLINEFVIVEDEITEEHRQTAYKEFCKKTKDVNIADRMTVKKWFGIGGFSKPRRENIFLMGFALKLSKNEVLRYLQEGIHEEGFQVNDYQEMIYMYGLENGLDFETCQKMICSFEAGLSPSLTLIQESNTVYLQKAYESNKKRKVEEFILFMKDNASYFKGYSYTALNYMKEYRKRILEIIRKEAKLCLEELLLETNYGEWKKSVLHRKMEDSFDNVKKYLKSKHGEGYKDGIGASILEYAKIAYSTLENNALIYSELFNQTSGNLWNKQSSIKGLSMKHMSDLFRIAHQKENAFRVIAAIYELENSETHADISKEVHMLLSELGFKGDKNDRNMVKDWLVQYNKEHKRRLISVRRGDLLPFVHYVAQHEYMEQIDLKHEEYKREDALHFFCQQANDVLTACNMIPLNEKYELDGMLLACFDEHELFGYSELMEAMSEKDINGYIK